MSLRGFNQLPVVLERRPTQVAATAPDESVAKQAATAEKLAAMSDQQLGLDKRQMIPELVKNFKKDVLGQPC